MVNSVGIKNSDVKHVTMPTLSTNVKLGLIGDSIIANFGKCSAVFFDKFFLPSSTLNFGISGEKCKMSYGVCDFTSMNGIRHYLL